MDGLPAQPDSAGMPPRLKTRFGPRALIFASQAIIALIVAATAGVFILKSYQGALEATERDLESLALILADHADRTFEAVDLLQTTFIETAQTGGIQTPDDFRRLMSTRDINRQLKHHGSEMPQLDSLGLVDTEGMVVNTSRAWPTPTLSIADRSYFKALKANPRRGTSISEPVMDRETQVLSVMIAHAVRSTEGEFVGVVLVGVQMSYFENLYQTIIKSKDTAIALLRKNGALLAGHPHVQQLLGQPMQGTQIISHEAPDDPDSSIAREVNPIDGNERLVARHALTQYPLLIAASAPVASVLAPWRKQTAYVGATGIALELVVAAVGMLMLRQFRNQRLLTEARAAQTEAEAARRGAEAALAVEQERERADRELRIQHVRFGAALSTMSEVLCMFDRQDRLVVGSDRLASMLGMPVASIAPGMTIPDIHHWLAKSSSTDASDFKQLLNAILRLKSQGVRSAHVQDLVDGRAVSANFAPMDDDGWLVTLEDITEQRLVEAKIAYMARHDALTGLANRVLFHERLGDAVAQSHRNQQSAILYLDLDHFKAVNDTLGHPMGDALLREVTKRLKDQVRDTDTVARLGGDEFAIVQTAINQPYDSTALAKRLIEIISAPYDLDGNRVNIGTSIGIALIPQDGDDPDQLMKAADLALYRSKGDGRGRYCYFEPAMDAQMKARRTLELEVRKALADGEFEMFYQPLINIESRSVCGFEALLRWRHPELGLRSPKDFIWLAEETGLINPIGTWVLRQACADAASWPDHVKVAINLSAVQFTNLRLVEDVAATLAASGLAPHRLELEITETAMLHDTDAVVATLHQLRGMGIRIALDDFGTGFSSLSYLRRFPFSKVKIDQSFVASLGVAADCDTIVAALVDLCNRLGMATTSEGVETEAQMRLLAEFGCTEAQGYLFSRAVPIEQVAELYATPYREKAIAG